MVLNDLKQKIIAMLNESRLPIDGIYYVTREVMQEVEMAYNQALQQEKQQQANNNVTVEEVKEEEPEIEAEQSQEKEKTEEGE